MKRIGFGLFAVVFTLAAAGPAAAAQSGPMATVRQFIDAFNNGDAQSEQAACAAQTGIIDDFPPHEWMTCSAWISSFDAFAKANEQTDAVVTLASPRHVDITGNLAYVVVPATYAYKDHGKPVVMSDATFTLVLKKSAAGWRITAWAWADH